MPDSVLAFTGLPLFHPGNMALFWLPLKPAYIARQPWWIFSLMFVESTSYVLDVTSFDFLP